jgi:hypothetical protein
MPPRQRIAQRVDPHEPAREHERHDRGEIAGALEQPRHFCMRPFRLVALIPPPRAGGRQHTHEGGDDVRPERVIRPKKSNMIAAAFDTRMM